MNKNSKGGSGPRFTPEKTKAWTLALYPGAILIGVAFMIATNRPITTDSIGLFVGLLTAGSLQIAVSRTGGKNAEYNDSGNSDNRIYGPSNEKLESDDRRGPDDPYSRFYGFRNAWRRQMGGLSAKG